MMTSMTRTEHAEQFDVFPKAPTGPKVTAVLADQLREELYDGT